MQLAIDFLGIRTFSDYDLLRSWRDTCELLDSSWGKFMPAELLDDLLGKRAAPVWQLDWRDHRHQLWQISKIQFIRFIEWRNHPAVRFHRNGYSRKDTGWFLLQDWEFKIDFLEQIILFDRHPATLPRPWIAAQHKRSLARLPTGEPARRQQCFAEGICWNCKRPIDPMMIDCPNCKAWYENF